MKRIIYRFGYWTRYYYAELEYYCPEFSTKVPLATFRQSQEPSVKYVKRQGRSIWKWEGEEPPSADEEAAMVRESATL
jgi:hypothetical protein